MTRLGLLRLLLLAVPLVVVPGALSFDTAKGLVLLVGAAVLAAFALPRTGEGPAARLALRWSLFTLAMALATAASAATAFAGPDPWAGTRAASLLLAAATVALAVENVLVEDGEVSGLLAPVALAGALVAAYGLCQRAGWDLPFPWRETHPGVPVATLGNPNFAAEFVAATLPACAFVAVRSRGTGRGIAVAGALLGLSLMVAARGRAAWAGLVLGGGTAAALAAAVACTGARRAAGLAAAAILGAGGLAASAGAYGGDAPAAWLGALGRTDTVLVRRELARGTGAMTLDHPLGVGAGNWAAAHPPYRTEAEYRASLFRDPGEAHCAPLQFAAEGGWAAAAAAAAAAALLGLATHRALRSGGDRGATAALAATAGTLGATALLSPVLHRPPMLLLGAATAGALAFQGGGRVVVLGAFGAAAQKALVAVLLVGIALHASAGAAEGPVVEARAILRSADPLPAAAARQALARAEHAAARDPGSVVAHALAGEIALRTADAVADPDEAASLRARARSRFLAARALRPLDPTAASNLAAAEAALGNAAAAEALWREALATQPWHREANHGLGFHLLRTGRPAEALAHLDRALAVDPLYAPSAGTRVEALQALGRDAEALEAASEAVDRFLAASPRRLDDAAEAARRAAAAAPLQARMLAGKAARLLDRGDREGAVAILAAVGASATEEEVHDALAASWQRAGRLPDALRSRVAARFAAAHRLLDAGDAAAAAAEARRALAIALPAADEVLARVRAAAILLRAGLREEAIGQIGVAMARGHPDPGGVEESADFATLRGDPAFRAALARSPSRRKE